MDREVSDVKAFHEKHDFPVGEELRPPIDELKTELLGYADAVETLGKRLRAQSSTREVRCGLVLEEAGEMVRGLANGDPVETLDALSDLIYVVVGTAVSYGLPLNAGFQEIHRSNMTKAKRLPDDRTLKQKGKTYEPPNLGKLFR